MCAAVATENLIRRISSDLAQMHEWASLAGMIDFLKLLGGSLVGLFRSGAAREVEMAFLRQQLLALKRSAPARLRLRNADRLIFVWLYRLFPSLLGATVIFKPETLVRWRRGGFRLYWRWKSRRRRVGRPAVQAEIRDLVRTMSRDNPLWRAPRSPWQNGHVERLIGSIRHEYLDHVVVLGERHLRELLANYSTYHNELRTHLALGTDAPLHWPVQTVGRIASVSWLVGLHHQYVRMA
jgi:hypothetical protein